MHTAHRQSDFPQREIQEYLEKRLLRTVNPVYDSRNQRNVFASNLIKSELVLPNGGSILNIGGGGKRHLAQNIDSPMYNVFEVDISGDNDLKFNLDCGSRLPLLDDTFDLCCAFDVLEHLEDFHACFDDLCRISSDKILVSLPIASFEFFWDMVASLKIKTLKDSTYLSKFYSLRESPTQDRHRWWLTLDDILRFCQSRENKYELSFNFALPQLSRRKHLLSKLFGPYRTRNLLYPWIWILINK